MERVPQLVRRGKKDRRMGAPSELDSIEALRPIQELIPPGGAGATKRSWRVRGTPAREKEK